VRDLEVAKAEALRQSLLCIMNYDPSRRRAAGMHDTLLNLRPVERLLLLEQDGVAEL
jgi:hypothetical protein